MDKALPLPQCHAPPLSSSPRDRQALDASPRAGSCRREHTGDTATAWSPCSQTGRKQGRHGAQRQMERGGAGTVRGGIATQEEREGLREGGGA